MSEPIIIEYKGFEIKFSEFDDAFNVSESGYKNQSLKKCKEYIDRVTKEEFDRVDVIIMGGGWKREAYSPAQVTSVEYDGRYASAWVIDAKKKRSKESIESLILDTPEARAELERVVLLRSKADKIATEANAIEKAIPRYQPKTKTQAQP